jgi:hypothetical protein
MTCHAHLQVYSASPDARELSTLPWRDFILVKAAGADIPGVADAMDRLVAAHTLNVHGLPF